MISVGRLVLAMVLPSLRSAPARVVVVCGVMWQQQQGVSAGDSREQNI
jgi:hypothetical protein